MYSDECFDLQINIERVELDLSSVIQIKTKVKAAVEQLHIHQHKSFHSFLTTAFALMAVGGTQPYPNCSEAKAGSFTLISNVSLKAWKKNI